MTLTQRVEQLETDLADARHRLALAERGWAEVGVIMREADKTPQPQPQPKLRLVK